MKVTDFTYLLENPSKVVDPLQTKQLEDILNEYPYFQAARALHLKGLKTLHSYKYNNALKVTAAYTADRDVLFDFITSKDFLQYEPESKIEHAQETRPKTVIVAGHQEEVLEQSEKITKNTTKTLAASESVTKEKAQPLPPPEPHKPEEAKTPPETLKPAEAEEEKRDLIEITEDRPLPQDAKDADDILDPELFITKHPTEQTAENLAVGEPLTFDRKEKFSFSEWLQLAGEKPTESRQEEKKKAPKKEKKTTVSNTTQNSKQKQKFDRIDKFISINPKIVPKENTPTPANIASSGILDKNELMTETLARVYLEQKKYRKAIQAYKILSLKYPKKSGFFADRIKLVQKIQLENR